MKNYYSCSLHIYFVMCIRVLPYFRILSLTNGHYYTKIYFSPKYRFGIVNDMPEET